MEDTKTTSLCHICYRHCVAERVTMPDGVYLKKTCVEHGESTHLLETDINSLRRKSLIFGLRVKDKFGDNGITGLSIIKVDGENAFIDTFLLSCRVLGKKIENEFMNYILNKLKVNNINYVKSEYIKTSKNSQTEEFYENFNFEVFKRKTNHKIYKLNLKESIFNMSPKIFKVTEHGN